MNLEIRVFNEAANEIYFKGLKNVRDIRQVLNKMRRGRSVVEKPHLTTLQIEGDKQAFRVGQEKDIEEWLAKRLKEERK